MKRTFHTAGLLLALAVTVGCEKESSAETCIDACSDRAWGIAGAMNVTCFERCLAAFRPIAQARKVPMADLDLARRALGLEG